ncbi:hypothetical protein QCA50_010437 [Cerrena zonata]|uniref:FAD-binding PCMH-type domain-containing protein n=1 Tax=Cerrena zonata TaxID=2478898 RepID=A0AAW0G8Q3_9APHY
MDRLFTTVLLLGAAFTHGATLHGPRGFNSTCTQIAQAVSSASTVSWPSSDLYNQDIAHWSLAGIEASACSVEPGTPSDVGKILQIVGANRTPFAVKGGGHATNPGFSSTTGVQIAMSKFSDVKYNAQTQTVDVGAGLVWEKVYEVLEPLGRNVVGGRTTGVGVAGFTLGGGYSWLTNQYGLSSDNVAAFELVLPSGQVKSVTQSSNPDLFFALRGGYNNFGIVTKFTLKTYPQGQVWGGQLTIGGDHLTEFHTALAKFSDNTDPKAQLLAPVIYVQAFGGPIVNLLLFYDGPTPPAGIFDDFLAIPNLAKDISTRSFLSIVGASMANTTEGSRDIFEFVPNTKYTPQFFQAVVNESLFWGQRLSNTSSTTSTFVYEPFLPTIFNHASASAYPFNRARAFLPSNLNFVWTSSADDLILQDAIRQSGKRLAEVAANDSADAATASIYGNYALFGTSVQRLYGSNLPRLRAIKATIRSPEYHESLLGAGRFECVDLDYSPLYTHYH